ncbi:DUF305 domain-containing protein [Sphaerisporangium album]|uniref:DUF305 domain-containing protein n=1 Tax=Sphaerisporangium album TaxID=509200 RepID=A0A367FR25_9ACTN|nr:DUF305 domain-containing protein [Sphaerisporangium album]RCG32359.1 DUF305 domain-containing protein [Sphaerisporangium album]
MRGLRVAGVLVGGLALAVPVLAGCAPASGGAVIVAATYDAPDVPWNLTDVLFCREMILHYRQSLTLAGIVGGRARDPFVKDMAARITADETPRIDAMAASLRAWRFTVPDARNPPDHQMPGMPSPAQILLLTGKAGAEFDRLWLTALARHTDYGARLAEKARDEGKDRATVALARTIAAAERARVARIVAHLR